MRIQLTISPNKQPVSFDYQQKIVGTIHRWIGENDIHGDVSLYSFSWLNNAKIDNGYLSFPNGTSMFISFHDETMIKRIISSIIDKPNMFCGMYVTDITLVNTPDLSQKSTFNCASPILVKRNQPDGTSKQYSYNDLETSELMKETLKTKMKHAGLEEDKTLEIRFDSSYSKKKTKLVHYHNIGNKANVCPIIIIGKTETKEFAWNVGIGNCTGIGFGAIY